MELKYLPVRTNELFYEAVSHLSLIATCNGFNEYQSPANNIFVRIPNVILEKRINENVVIFIEPQINLSASVRMQSTVYKIQLTVLPDFSQRFRGVRVSSFEKQVDFRSFVHILQLCDSWSSAISEMLKEPQTLGI